MKSGCRLVLYSWSGTGFSVKYSYVDEFVEGKSVNVTKSTSTLGYIYDLPISHVLYTFDKEDVTVFLIEHNNTIYMNENIIDSLSNPIQCEDNDVRVYLRPKVYYPNNNNKQSINFPDESSIPFEYNGVLPCIAVRKPNNYEVEHCEWISLTSKFNWGPYGKVGNFSKVEAH